MKSKVLPHCICFGFDSFLTPTSNFFFLLFAHHFLGSKAPSGKTVTYVGPLPLGSWLILFNCFIYGFTFRLDRSAVQAGGKSVYYMYVNAQADTLHCARAKEKMKQFI